MKKLFSAIILCSIFLTLIYAGCKSDAQTAKTIINQDPLILGSFKLLSLKDSSSTLVTLPSGFNANLILTSDSLKGKVGFNYYFGTYQIPSQNNIRINNRGSTLVQDRFVDLENRYLRLLNNASSYQIKDSTLNIISTNSSYFLVFIKN